MKKVIRLLAVFAVSASFAVACKQQAVMSGQDYVNEIVTRFSSEISSETILGDAENEAVYNKAADGEEDAYTECCTWVYEDFSGDSYTFVIPDGMGTVKAVKAEEEGEYYYLTFKLKGYSEFMLKFLNKNRMEDDNVLIRQPLFPPRGGGNTAL